MNQNEFEIENGVLTAYHGAGGNVTIPAGVTQIGTEAFSGCRALSGVTFPDGLERIGNFAFANCTGLTALSFPEGLCCIERSAFSRCTGLQSVSLPQSLAALGEFAFALCRAPPEILLPDTQTQIGRSAVSQCRSLTQVHLPARLTALPQGLFYGCSALTEIMLPEALSAVDLGAFSGCTRLTRVSVDAANPHFCAIDGLLYSRDGTRLVFCPGARTDVSLPAQVLEIGALAFAESTLERVVLPDGVIKIGDGAFRRCTRLPELRLPAGLRHLGAAAFSDCTMLQSLVLPEQMRDCGAGAFRGCTALCYLALPRGLPFDPHWFATPNDPDCFSVDHTVIPFASTRPLAEIRSPLGARHAAFGFIHATLADIPIDAEIAAGYTDYIASHSALFREELLADDRVLHWMCSHQIIAQGEIEPLLEQAAAEGRASAAAILLEYQSRVFSAVQPGGALEQRFSRLEDALSL